MKRLKGARLLRGASIAALCVLSPQTGFAEAGAEETFSLGTIVITGEKLARSLQRTASSVSALDAAAVARENEAGKDSLAKAAEGMANVTTPAAGGQGGAPTIRGQDSEGPNSGATAFFGGTVPRMAVSVDGHYLTYNELVWSSAAIWDVDGIEVFRGPQTVTQGANSIAGAMIVTTKDPSFTREGAVQLQYGSDNRRRVSAVVSGPVATDLAARLSVDYSARDTYISYTNSAFAPGGTEQDFDAKTLRFKLLWQPAGLSGFEAKLSFAHVDTTRPTWEAAMAPYEDLASTVTGNPSWDLRSNATVLDLSHDFGNGVKIVNSLRVADVHTSRITEPVTSGSAENDQDIVSNETRLTFGDEMSTFSGLAGLFLSSTKTDETLNLRGSTVYEDEKRSTGVFTELNYRFAPDWMVTGGLRYQRDAVERRGTSSFTPDVLDYDRTFDAWLPKLALTHDLNDTTSIGAMVSKGYNPGGVTLGFVSKDYVTFAPETVWNYELFGRTKLFDERLDLTGNLFYSRMKDAQRYVTSVIEGGYTDAVTVNADKAESYGLELGFRFAARDDLTLRGNLGLLHTEIVSFENALADYEGHEFGRAPSRTLSLGADWAIRPDVTLAGTVRYTDAYFSDDTNATALLIDAHTVADARVTWTPREDLSLFAYVNNIFDDRSVTNLRALQGTLQGTVVDPRSVGVGLKMTF
ncbi:TonB-dependent receptor [Rhodobacter capsulatus]|uniref:TonB-dependent receptor n=1 Tax=Rhodobacter capsulatus TaxID=1061 RepID=A0A4U1JKU2_RHOCA|nr:TonB-dependent receptor [Rhodobacter capsulatus]TKD13416.1 TonB-dependent receptor [Rhodobacter capsulatus]